MLQLVRVGDPDFLTLDHRQHARHELFVHLVQDGGGIRGWGLEPLDNFLAVNFT